MMLELSDEAVMARALSVLMEEIVKLRGNFQSTNPEPQREHHRHGRETAVVAPMLCCRRKLHAEL
jgi:hypothetical protein